MKYLFQKLEGIILRSIDYGESNKIITIFSRELGKVGAVARGAKKPNNRFVSVSQPFTYGYFVCTMGSGLGNLQQGESIEGFRHIKEDLMKTAYAAYIVELLDKGTEEKKSNPYLFELLLQTLRYLNEDYDPDIIKNIFEIKMLSVLGLQPKLDCCSVCGNTNGPFSFSVKEAGLLCANCTHRDLHTFKVSQATIKLLRVFYYLDIMKIGSISVKETTKKELELCISSYYDEYSGLYLKSKRFLKQMENFNSKWNQ